MKKVFALALLLVAGGAQAQTVPTGREVFARGIREAGMDTVMPKHTSLKTVGAFSVPDQGVSAPFVMLRSARGAYRMSIEVEGFGTIESGYADSTAWTINPQSGAALGTASQAISLRRNAVWIDSPENYTTLENKGVEKFEGNDTYRIEMVAKDGAKLTRFYDVKTGLLAGTLSTQESAAGPVEVRSIISDYRTFGGAKFPTRQVQMAGDVTQVLTVEGVEFDAVLPAALELPAEIKTLKGKS